MYINICAELRQSSLENIGQDEFILYFSMRSEVLKTQELSHSGIFKFSFNKYLKLLSRSDQIVLEIPEPLFVRFWFKGFILALIGKMFCKLKNIRICVTTYAIENLSYSSRCTLPLFDRLPRLNSLFSNFLVSIIGRSSSIIDIVGFGTEASISNYAEKKFFRQDTQEFLATDYLESCRCISTENEKIKLVLFLGEKSERKSTDETYNAFKNLALLHRDWTFRMIGPGIDEYDDPELSNFILSGALSRAEIHSFLRTSKYVVLASKRLPRWREQIGLPLLEGLAHHNRVFSTKETGLYSDDFSHMAVNWLDDSTTQCIVRAVSDEITLNRITQLKNVKFTVPSEIYFRKSVKEWFKSQEH